jgi:hypothetical protein
MYKLAPPIAYHTLITQFTQIYLQKNERIRDFNVWFFKTLHQTLEEQHPNQPVIFGCYKGSIPSNVSNEITNSQINTLDDAMRKATEMEGYMLKSNGDPEIVLGRVQRQMSSLLVSSQVPSTSREIE